MHPTSEPVPSLRIYDTLNRTKKPFEPLVAGHVSMYVCGVTVYDLTHIGHARVFVFFDVVGRVLKRLGYDVRYVRNHTDVDDKILARAAERGEEPLALSKRFIGELHVDMDNLGVARPDVEPLVSGTIPEIIEMVELLVEKGFAYEAQGNVFYRVRNFEGYGKLSGRKLEDMEAGRSGRVAGAEASIKEHPFDFALWKAAGDDDLSWESPWGSGRPGWHIECSAMSRKHLGDSFDIHGGGQDLTFPHHENEIAQSEACTGEHYTNNWMHVAMVNVDNVKMSKSLGNFWTTRDVLSTYHAETVRFFMLGTHYRHPINYSNDMLNQATRRMVYMYGALERLDDALTRAGVEPGAVVTDGQLSGESAKAIASAPGRILEALTDDFNTALASSILQELARHANDLTTAKKKAKGDKLYTLAALRNMLVECAAPLGLLQGEPGVVSLELRDMAAALMGVDKAWVESQIKARAQARADKDWDGADAIRQAMLNAQIEIMDGTEGTTWRISFDEDDA